MIRDPLLIFKSKTLARAPHCSLSHVTMFSYNAFAAVMLDSTPITSHHLFWPILDTSKPKPRFTANPDLPRVLAFPKTRGKSGFYCASCTKSCMAIPIDYRDHVILSFFFIID